MALFSVVPPASSATLTSSRLAASPCSIKKKNLYVMGTSGGWVFASILVVALRPALLTLNFSSYNL